MIDEIFNFGQGLLSAGWWASLAWPVIWALIKERLIHPYLDLDLDYYDRMAVGGVTQDPAGETLVGVSRYARIAGTRRAECAIVVADGWQGRGLGTELMRTLADAAKARAIDCLEGTTLAENARIAAWARRFGFSVRTEPNSGGLVVVKLDL